MKTIRIHPDDNVAVALTALCAHERIDGFDLCAAEAIGPGHKLALRPIRAGEAVVKYGCPIGIASRDIAPGAWVHVHNMRTALTEKTAYAYHPETYPLPAVQPRTFSGFRRADGRAAVRNELWILPTVGCVNDTARALAQHGQALVHGNVEGVYAFPHPYGCSQLGEDHAMTRRLLASLARHPNAGGVLVLGLGCENLTQEQFKEELGAWDEKRVKFLVCQDVPDEMAEGERLLRELAEYAQGFSREEIPASELVVGLKCGGSDGLSGITANPAVGAFSDRLVSLGGTAILTEVPEMFGAEEILLSRCENEEVFDRAAAMIDRFKRYFVEHGQTVYENPSPGNRAGGITTLEDKSCGCVQKGGRAPITDVLDYGQQAKKKGLNLLSGPGNDLVSSTALAAAGAHILLFTTGRGTPFGAPVPTIKISSNTDLYKRKNAWIDFDAGTIAAGEAVEDTGERLLDEVLSAAGGKKTRSELRGERQIAVFKDGVTL